MRISSPEGITIYLESKEDFDAKHQCCEKLAMDGTSTKQPRYIMKLTLSQLTKDISNLDIEDVFSCWKWKVAELKSVAVMSVLRDLFLVGQDDAIYWLQTDSGDLTKVAEGLQQFECDLNDEEKVDKWFLPLLVKKLIIAGKTLKENEVYSYKILPALGGEYSVDNIEPIDISVHFALAGQICEQIKDLPEGTKVNVKLDH